MLERFIELASMLRSFHHAEALRRKASADPLARTRFNSRRGQSILELPNAVAQPWIVERPGAPAGRLLERTWTSALLKNERPVWVYTPAGYRTDGNRYALLITTDGDAYVNGQQAIVSLNNLIADKRIPPIVAVFIGNVPSVPGQRPARATELTCNKSFVEFLSTEILPWVRSEYHVTTGAAQTIIAGASYGGLTAAFAALLKPDVFGNVLSQSGAFWWRPRGDVESEWLAREYAARPATRVKFYMDAGLLETGGGLGQVGREPSLDWVNDDEQYVPFSPALLFANRHMRDVLKAKGYSVHYAEVSGAHNALSWRGTFADGLIALIGDK
jgi:enterochelin esterase family protein